MRFFIITFIFILFNIYHSFGQPKTSGTKSDSIRADSIKIDSIKRDSTADSTKTSRYTIDNVPADSVRKSEILRSKTYEVILDRLLKENKYAAFSSPPVYFISAKKQGVGTEYLFYLLGSLLLVFGFFKIFYLKYFNNIFRVFFNTSLRQNQLTDLLLQARLPSLIFNIFFTVMGGIYLWFILQYYGLIAYHNKTYLLVSIIVIGLIYCTKFLVLKFLGWITGLENAFDTYIFVLFLINKIVGIILIPFIVMLAFGSSQWLDNTVILSLLILGIFFLLRFFRSYNLIQHQLDIHRFHFFLYVLSIEILPLFLIFKTLLKISSFAVV